MREGSRAQAPPYGTVRAPPKEDRELRMLVLEWHLDLAQACKPFYRWTNRDVHLGLDPDLRTRPFRGRAGPATAF